jgi:hypothetical protein
MARTKALFILVEGDNDERFVRAVVVPNLPKRYDEIVVFKCAEEKDPVVDAVIDVAQQMGADYICLIDLDDCPCVTRAKDDAVRKYPHVERERIAVAKLEIEGWYLAGLTKKTAVSVGLEESWGTGQVEDVTKERFRALRPTRYAAETAFRVEILKNFERRAAMRRSPSFAHFARKYLG